MSRNLIGYGGAWPDLTWPNGNRLTVAVVINFEEGVERQMRDGDQVSERIGEVVSVVPEGRPDPDQAQIFAYGICATERAARVLKILAKDGHETASHGWLWQPRAEYDTPEDEAAYLDRTAAAIEAATGTKPIGFCCRWAGHPCTRAFLAERSYLSPCNGFGDELSYRCKSRLIVVPYALGLLEAEAARGLPRQKNVGFHLHIVGRPGRLTAFERILALLDARRARLWLAPRGERARAYVAACPA